MLSWLFGWDFWRVELGVFQDDRVTLISTYPSWLSSDFGVNIWSANGFLGSRFEWATETWNKIYLTFRLALWMLALLGDGISSDTMASKLCPRMYSGCVQIITKAVIANSW